MSDVTDLGRYKYDKQLKQSEECIEVIEPPPVHALHKHMKRKKQRAYAAKLRLSAPPVPFKPRVVSHYRDPPPMDYGYEPPPGPRPKPKPKKRGRPKGSKLSPLGGSPIEKVMKDMVLEGFKEGKFTRSREWTEKAGWFWEYTATPEHFAELFDGG